MQKGTIRVISVILSVLMITSIFTALPLTASAAEASAPAGDTISEAEITEFTVPMEGIKAATKSQLMSTGALVDRLEWYDEYNSRINGDFAFAYGKKYTALIYLKPYGEGDTFPFTGDTSKDKIKVTVNDGAVEVDDTYNYSLSETSYVFRVKAKTAVPANGKTGDCKWSFNTSDGSLTISGTGEMADYEGFGYTPWASTIHELKKVVVEDLVYNVGDYAFTNTNVEEVVLGDDVQTTGKFAFYGCRDMTSLTLGMVVSKIGYFSFAYCSKLTSLSLTDFCKEIDQAAFYCCEKLESVSFSNNLTTVGDSAFGWTALKSVTLPKSINSIGSDAFGYNGSTPVENFIIYGYSGTAAEDYADANGFIFSPRAVTGTTGDCDWEYVKDTKTLIINGKGEGKMADYNNSDNPAPWAKYKDNIKTLQFTGDVTYIGEYAFNELKAIENNVMLPATVTEIGKYAFCNCEKLTGIELMSVKSIGEYAFSGCKALESVSFGDQLTYLNEYAFDSCSGLTSVSFSACPLDIIGYSAFQRCSALTSVRIPENVEVIGAWAFSNCTGLTTVEFPDNSKLSTIERQAFRYCTALNNIIFPDSLDTISYYAFCYCSALDSIKLNDGITKIYNEAFVGTAVTSVNIPQSVTTIGEKALGYDKDENVKPSLDIYGVKGTAAETYAGTHENFNFIAVSPTYGTTGECTWKYDGDTRTLTISGYGKTADYETPQDVPWYPYTSGDDTPSLIIGDEVTGLGKNTLCDFWDVTVPANVTSIADGAIGFDHDGNKLAFYNKEGVLRRGTNLRGYAGTAAEGYAAQYDHVVFNDLTDHSKDEYLVFMFDSTDYLLDGSDDNSKMKKDGDVYTLTINNVKANNKDKHYIVVGVTNPDSKVITYYGEYGESSAPLTFALDDDCDVTVTFDPSSKKLTADGTGYKRLDQTIPDELYVYLGHVKRTPAMKEVSENVYETTIRGLESEGDYALYFTDDFGAVAWGSKTEAPVEFGKEFSIPFLAAGSETLRVVVPKADGKMFDLKVHLDLTKWDFKTNTGATCTLTLTEREPELYYEVTCWYYDTVFNYEYIAYYDDMEKNGDGTFTFTVKDVKALENTIYKAFVNEYKELDWRYHEYYGADGKDTKPFEFIMTGDGDVTFTFDSKTGKVTAAGPTVKQYDYTIKSVSVVDDEFGFEGDQKQMTEVTPGVYELTVEGLYRDGYYDFKFMANDTLGFFICCDTYEDIELGKTIEADYDNWVIGFEIPASGDEEKADIKITFDTTKWNAATKTGATYKVSVVGDEPEVLIGDADGNGKIDINDATTVQKHVAHLITLTGDRLKAADANGDGKVDINDATAIQKYIAKLIPNLGKPGK